MCLTGKVIKLPTTICEPNVDTFWSGGLALFVACYRTFNDHVWANNKDNYRRDETISMTLPIITRTILAVKIAFCQYESVIARRLGFCVLKYVWRDYWGRSGSSKNYQLSYSTTCEG